MAEENKVRSKTEEFKIALQATVSEVLGVKVSKQAAWDLFKALVKKPYDFILANYAAAGKPEISYGSKHKELELPLSGVGTFKVITTGKEGNTSVRGRWYLSSSIDKAIREALGFADTEADTEEANVAPAETADDLDLDL
jgi:hypothetical protein